MAKPDMVKEGPDFATAAYFLPSLSALYGFGYSMEVRLAEDGLLIVAQHGHLFRFTETDSGMVQVEDNVAQAINHEDSSYTDEDTADWKPTESYHFRDLIEAAVHVMGVAVYG